MVVPSKNTICHGPLPFLPEEQMRRITTFLPSFFSCIGLAPGSAAQGYIGLYEGDVTLLSESLENVQRPSTQILNAIGAVGTSALLPCYVELYLSCKILGFAL
jgi:hypothetical protein